MSTSRNHDTANRAPVDDEIPKTILSSDNRVSLPFDFVGPHDQKFDIKRQKQKTGPTRLSDGRRTVARD